MKKTLSVILSLLLVVLINSSCKKDFAQEQYTATITPIKPDLSVKLRANFSGFVTDENDAAIIGAKVIAGDKETLTDEYGYFHLENALVPEQAGLVKVTKDNYFSAYKTVLPKAGKESFIRISLLPKNNAGSINGSTGGSVTISGGANLFLPVNGVIIASSGIPYTGSVQVAAQFIDPSQIKAAQQRAPGDGRGIDKEGSLRLLNSYSMLAVELSSPSGERLQIATGKQATLTMPVPATMRSTAPASIDLWSFDESTGLWKQENTAVKNGDSYTAMVSHFSFWDGAVGVPLVQLNAQIVNNALQPLANVAVGIRVAGQPFNAGYSAFGFTDVNGNVSGAVPANRQLVLNVLTPCETEAFSKDFTTTNSNIDLGVITGNLGQSLVTITGTVTDCNNQPVTNGYVQTYDNGFNNRINIVNGSFSYTGLACSSTTASYVAIDKTTNQQSTVQAVTLTTGTHNLGTLSACGTSILGFINYTIDGIPGTLTDPGDTLAGFHNTIGPGYTTILPLHNDPVLGTAFQFEITGPATVAGTHTVQEIFSYKFPGGRGLTSSPFNITITEFGPAGGFISGSFSATVGDFSTGAPHTVSCTFRIKRWA